MSCRILKFTRSSGKRMSGLQVASTALCIKNMSVMQEELSSESVPWNVKVFIYQLRVLKTRNQKFQNHLNNSCAPRYCGLMMGSCNAVSMTILMKWHVTPLPLFALFFEGGSWKRLHFCFAESKSASRGDNSAELLRHNLDWHLQSSRWEGYPAHWQTGKVKTEDEICMLLQVFQLQMMETS